MTPQARVALVATIGVGVVILGFILAQAFMDKPKAPVNGDEIRRAVQEYCDAHRPYPETVTFSQLIEQGYLGANALQRFGAKEVTVHLRPQDANPQSYLMDALMLDGTHVGLMSDGSVQQLSGNLRNAILQAESGHPLFDGNTFKGWIGDTNHTWRIEEGALVGGSLSTNVPRNEFLCTERNYTNFLLRLKFKLNGKSGFINGGVQFRSQRAASPPNEMVGYQADIGEPSYWGSLYDESRRNKTLVPAPMDQLQKVLNRDDWNLYEIRCEGRRIRLAINGVQTVDYTEADDSIPQFGLIGLQIHGGAVAEAAYKDITIQELP